tara:strand:+ start:1599 stop:2186 length:588 start_codon:yes stop_codon:yes gene_type:complete
MIISLCTDLAKLKENPNIKPVDGEEPLPASEIHNTGGTNIFYTDNTTVCGLTSLNGLDFLLELDYVVITSYEEIFGYYKQSVSEEGELLWQEPYTVTPEPYVKVTDNYVATDEQDEFGMDIYINEPIEKTITPEPYEQIDPVMELVPAIPAMTALYDQIYPRTPVSLPDGEVYTPPILMGVAAGYDTSNLDISER